MSIKLQSKMKLAFFFFRKRNTVRGKREKPRLIGTNTGHLNNSDRPQCLGGWLKFTIGLSKREWRVESVGYSFLRLFFTLSTFLHHLIHLLSWYFVSLNPAHWAGNHCPRPQTSCHPSTPPPHPLILYRTFSWIPSFQILKLFFNLLHSSVFFVCAKFPNHLYSFLFTPFPP